VVVSVKESVTVKLSVVSKVVCATKLVNSYISKQIGKKIYRCSGCEGIGNRETVCGVKSRLCHKISKFLYSETDWQKYKTYRFSSCERIGDRETVCGIKSRLCHKISKFLYFKTDWQGNLPF
jgi:hypothetical protein